MMTMTFEIIIEVNKSFAVAYQATSQNIMQMLTQLFTQQQPCEF